MISAKSTLVDVCFAVCTALNRNGTRAVLSGGSAATYYAPNRYQSLDADFVIVMSSKISSPADTLANIGYVERGGAYHHPQSRYTVDFPSGPLSVGGKIISRYDTVRRNGEVLYIISRTDSVCDRLAAFYHWDDRSSLRTALDVATSGAIDIPEIRSWSEQERQLAKFDEFSRRYAEEMTSRRK